MRPLSIRLLVTLATAVGIAAAVTPVAAQMTLLTDARSVVAHATSAGVSDGQAWAPTVAGDPWDQTAYVQVFGDPEGEASATAWQNSEFYSAGIFASGGATGEFQVATGDFGATSTFALIFRTDTCTSWFLDGTVDGADPPGAGSAELALNVLLGPELAAVASGHAVLQGKLGPGRYIMEATSAVSSAAGSYQQAPTYSIIWTCQPCASRLIGLQPKDVVVSSGAGASFTVGTAAAAAEDAATSYTFQWRKNNVPLANGGHYSGVTTSTLSISSASLADTGWYNVVVNNGAEDEPSSFAHLRLAGTASVAPPILGVAAFRVESPTPNPSAGATTFRFSAEHAMPVEAAIYDAAGRLVTPLANHVITGAGAWTWDGRTNGGDGVPAGVYFLRVRADGRALVRRFVRIR